MIDPACRLFSLLFEILSQMIETFWTRLVPIVNHRWTSMAVWNMQEGEEP